MAENKSVRIFHTADIHLDSPFTVFSPSEADRRRIELRGVFDSAVLYAKSQKTELFFISGDLFDSRLVTKDTLELLSREFASFPTCRFFISPGNHDPYNDVSPYTKYKFPSNVHVFGRKERVEIAELGVCIYGCGFTSQSNITSPVAGFGLLNPDYINILVCHGDIGNPVSKYGPITKRDISVSGFDYIAIGHKHTGTDVCCENGVSYAYPGCIEGRGFDETGYKGALCGTVSKGSVSLNKIRFSTKRYETAAVDLTDAVSKTEAVERIRSDIKQFCSDTALRLTLKGTVKASFLITEQDIGSGMQYPYAIEIIDETVPEPDFTSLETQTTIKGVYYRTALERINKTSPDSEERSILIEALKYGLAALEGRDIS